MARLTLNRPSAPCVKSPVTLEAPASPSTPALPRLPAISAPGSAPTASFQFDVPVRFDTDILPVQASAWDLQIVNNIDLAEVLD